MPGFSVSVKLSATVLGTVESAADADPAAISDPKIAAITGLNVEKCGLVRERIELKNLKVSGGKNPPLRRRR